MTHSVHMEQVGKKNKKGRKAAAAAVAVLLCVALIASGGFVGLGFLKDRGNDYKNSSYNAFTEGFTDISVTDEKSAVEAVASVADTIGIGDVEKELKVISKNTVDGDSYYRMQQYYNGIPVYGKSVVVSAGEDGETRALTSNFASITYDVSLEPTADFEAIEKSLQNYFGVDSIDFSVDENDLVIYQTENGDFVLSYELMLMGKRIIIDANSTEILSTGDLFVQDMVECEYSDGYFKGIKISESEYMIGDEEKGIFVFNADYREVIKTEEVNGDTVYVPASENSFPMTSSDNYFGNNDSFAAEEYSKAVYALKSLDTITNYYNDMDENLDTSVILTINDSYDSDNAFGGYTRIEEVTDADVPYEKEKIAAIFMGHELCNDIYSHLDTMGHEYMHGINHRYFYSDTDDSSAIDEGYADIFGELLEAKIKKQSPDWVHGQRNMRNTFDYPDADQAYPASMEDLKNSRTFTKDGSVWYYTTANSGSDYSHFASTVISHSAYLMWNGIDGTTSRKISSEKLGKLWYRSLMLLQDNADFSQCRNAVEMSARTMMKNGQLTEEQYKTVEAAFDRVGIDNAVFTCSETVKNRFDLSVVTGVEGGVINADAEVVGFNLEVIKMPVIKAGPGIVNNEMPETIIRKKVNSGRETLELENGTYVLRLTDLNDNKGVSKAVNVKIVVDGSNSSAKDEIVVNTDFTPVIVVILDGTNDGDPTPEEDTSSTEPSSGDDNSSQIPSPEFIVDIYMADKSLWLLPIEDKPIMGGYAYCFIDLDFDGVLELIRCVNDGSGKYSYNNYYRVSPENLKVEEFEISSDRQMGGIDYYTMAATSKLLKDNFDGRMFYVFADFIRDGSEAGAMIYYENYMKGTVAYAKELYGEYWGVDYSVTPNQEKREYTFDNSDVSEAEYNRKVAAFYDECTDLNLVWKYADGIAMEKADDSTKRQLLLDAYNGFSYDGFSFSGAASEGSDMWKIMPDTFIHTSGAGGWATYLTVNDDGSFTGEYHDSEMGVTGDGYPNGTVYICEFKGKFTEPKKINEYTYSMNIEELTNKKNAGTEYIENGVKYICTEAIGLSNANEIYIYLPGAPLSDVDETFMTWSHLDTKGLERLPDDFYGIFNVNAGKGFVTYDN